MAKRNKSATAEVTVYADVSSLTNHSALQWVASDDGRRAIDEARQAAEKAREQLRKDSRLDPEVLHKPVTC